MLGQKFVKFFVGKKFILKLSDLWIECQTHFKFPSIYDYIWRQQETKSVTLCQSWEVDWTELYASRVYKRVNYLSIAVYKSKRLEILNLFFFMITCKVLNKTWCNCHACYNLYLCSLFDNAYLLKESVELLHHFFKKMRKETDFFFKVNKEYLLNTFDQNYSRFIRNLRKERH